MCEIFLADDCHLMLLNPVKNAGDPGSVLQSLQRYWPYNKYKED